MRIIAKASELPSVMVEAKDDNGQTITDKTTGNALMVNQKDEAIRVLKDLFIGFGQQQMGKTELKDHHAALQELLNNDKIDDRYKTWIKESQAKVENLAAANPADQELQYYNDPNKKFNIP